jgi:hypothetical protein
MKPEMFIREHDHATYYVTDARWRKPAGSPIWSH